MTFLTRRPSMFRLALGLMLFVPTGFARPRTDTVTLVNGNDVTCQILNLSRGVLNARTDSLSAVSIRWHDVTRIRSEFVFEIVLVDGTTLFGALTPDPAGNLMLPGAAAIPLINVVSLTPIESRIINRFNGSVDFGYNFQKSNATTQLAFDGDLVYKTQRRSVEGQVSSNLIVRKGTSSTRKNQDSLILHQTLSRNYFAEVLGQFSTNDELNLIRRYLGGLGFGRYVIHTNRSIVAVDGGAAYSTERYTGDLRRNNAETLIEVNTQTFRLYSPKLDISGDFRLWPNLTTSGRFRIDGLAKAKFEVYKNLFVSFSVTDNYDRKNPTTSRPLNDYSAVMSVGYTFNR